MGAFRLSAAGIRFADPRRCDPPGGDRRLADADGPRSRSLSYPTEMNARA
jgi:hypothetical protein